MPGRRNLYLRGMRLLLTLLSFLALALAPVAAPAKATVPAPQSHCAEMAGMDHHPAKPTLGNDAKCCVALPAALPPSAAAAPVASDLAETVTAAAVNQLAAIQFEAEDPPPRS